MLPQGYGLSDKQSRVMSEHWSMMWYQTVESCSDCPVKSTGETHVLLFCSSSRNVSISYVQQSLRRPHSASNPHDWQHASYPGLSFSPLRPEENKTEE
ncbi:hypothetical protein MAR_011159 [Mya arenaria]|uniref:Uncharacterized protein n=1 Tax=Mya arenaria TaxID=6604 RepID=A0ABY7FTX6_MYAAR|nr:hypothetical protein MAR_011159 [Mya arenaria]